jgi:hypothetical protein
MTHKAFFSFHYGQDHERASTIHNMGQVDSNQPAPAEVWKKVTEQDDETIKKWIDKQLDDKSVAIVLIGENTIDRKWLNYEIKTAWENNKGVVGIYIHNLENGNGEQSLKGENPFDSININGTALSSIVKAYEPPYISSSYTYDHINERLSLWVEKALEIRLEHN